MGSASLNPKWQVVKAAHLTSQDQRTWEWSVPCPGTVMVWLTVSLACLYFFLNPVFTFFLQFCFYLFTIFTFLQSRLYLFTILSLPFLQSQFPTLPCRMSQFSGRCGADCHCPYLSHGDSSLPWPGHGSYFSGRCGADSVTVLIFPMMVVPYLAMACIMGSAGWF